MALLMFFPILWMLLAAFKTEIDAIAPPKLFVEPTLEHFAAVNQRADYFRYAMRKGHHRRYQYRARGIGPSVKAVKLDVTDLGAIDKVVAANRCRIWRHRYSGQ